jgi:hypothetical protein
MVTTLTAAVVWVGLGSSRYWRRYERKGDVFIYDDEFRERWRGKGAVVECEAVPFMRSEDGRAQFVWAVAAK